MNRSKDLPVYRLLVETLQRGFKVLDSKVQQEIVTFIHSQQNKKGAFSDRAGKPDLYYSLFGLWLSLATKQTTLTNKLKGFLLTVEQEKQGPVEQMALALIEAELLPGDQQKSIFSLLQMLNRQGKNISSSYRFFFVRLTC